MYSDYLLLNIIDKVTLWTKFFWQNIGKIHVFVEYAVSRWIRKVQTKSTPHY